MGRLITTRSEQFPSFSESGITHETPTLPDRTTTTSEGESVDLRIFWWNLGEINWSPSGLNRFARTFWLRKNRISSGTYSFFIGPTKPTVTRSTPLIMCAHFQPEGAGNGMSFSRKESNSQFLPVRSKACWRFSFATFSNSFVAGSSFGFCGTRRP